MLASKPVWCQAPNQAVNTGGYISADSPATNTRSIKKNGILQEINLRPTRIATRLLLHVIESRWREPQRRLTDFDFATKTD
jgi:hypothetical protein